MKKENLNLLMLGLGALGILGMKKYEGWTVPDKAKPYLQDFYSATIKYNLPPFLLVRVAEQESDFNPLAINVGSNAQGMMQVVPKWHPELEDPYDPEQAIPYAASYLRKLHNRFGSWKLALMAYNWGPGNVSKWLKDKTIKVPSETQKYHFEILRDVKNAQGAV